MIEPHYRVRQTSATAGSSNTRVPKQRGGDERERTREKKGPQSSPDQTRPDRMDLHIITSSVGEFSGLFIATSSFAFIIAVAVASSISSTARSSLRLVRSCHSLTPSLSYSPIPTSANIEPDLTLRLPVSPTHKHIAFSLSLSLAFHLVRKQTLVPNTSQATKRTR